MKIGWWKAARLLLAWGAGLYLANLYIEMGWVKFDPQGFWTDAFVHWGYPTWLGITVGVLEVAGGAMLVIPWLASYGAAAVGVVM